MCKVFIFCLGIEIYRYQIYNIFLYGFYPPRGTISFFHDFLAVDLLLLKIIYVMYLFSVSELKYIVIKFHTHFHPAAFSNNGRFWHRSFSQLLTKDIIFF